MDLKQVWFSGSHTDVGGGANAPSQKCLQSDFPLMWMVNEAEKAGLSVKKHIKIPRRSLNIDAKLTNSFKGLIELLGKKEREIPNPKEIPTFVHKSVFDRIQNSKYTSKQINCYVSTYGSQPPVEPY